MRAPQLQQVVRRLDRRKAFPGHDQRLGSLEAFDGRTHRSLKLIATWTRRVPGVHLLLVADHREGQSLGRSFEGQGQHVQIEPNVIRIEVAILRDVLEAVEVRFGTLRDFA